MRRAILAGLFALGGCQYIPGTEANMEHRARDVLSDTLYDATSAQFRDLWTINDGKSKMICGNVNAKNQFGGYIGFRHFVVSYEQRFGVIDPIIGEAEMGDSKEAMEERAVSDGFKAIWPECEKGRR